MKRLLNLIFTALLGCVLTIGLAGCNRLDNTHRPLRVGVVSGPEADLLKVAKNLLEKQHGVLIKVIEFSDYHLINAALHDGSLDANMFQHQPYLEIELQHKHYPFFIMGKTFYYPSGIYASKLKNLAQLQPGALVAIANDPTNEGRALLLLEKAGLIKLNPAVGFLATPKAIQYNPKNLRFKELDAAQLTRALQDVDIAVINTNYAVLAKLYPSRDALFTEDKYSPYANVVVVREKDKDKPQLKQLVAALHAAEVVEAANSLFQGEAIPAW